MLTWFFDYFIFVKPKGILSLQKHHHRAEHWLVTQGNAKIPFGLTNNSLTKNSFPSNKLVYLPQGR